MRNIAILGVHSALGAEMLAHALAMNDAGRVFVLDELNDPALEEDVANFLGSKGLGEHPALVWQRLRTAEHMLGMTRTQSEQLLGSPLAVFVVPHQPVPGMTGDQIRCLATSGIKHLSGMLKDCDAQINYVSSYLVAGNRTGAFTEYDVDCGQHARNAHEHAAMAGEFEARSLFAKARLKVFRVPFLAGAASGGLFDARAELSLLCRHLKRSKAVFASPDAVVPTAPVDIVSRHILAIAAASDSCDTYHVDHCGLSVEEMRRQLQAPEAGYRGLGAYRLRSLLHGNGSGLATGEEAWTVPFSAAHYMYPQVHYDHYRYVRVAERLGLPSMRDDQTVRIDSFRNDAQQARYAAALVAYADAASVGVLEHDGSWARSVVIDDTALSFLDTGEGSPVVFLSGALGPECWFGAVRYLMSRHRCIVLPIVGWGAVAPNNDQYAGHDAQAGLIKGLLAYLELRDACHFVATDVSAPIMQYFASRWPEKIASLQLLNPITSPQESARCIPTSMRARLENDKGLTKLVADLDKSDLHLRSISAFDTLIPRQSRRTPQRWRRLRDNIAADRARLKLLCAAWRERLASNDLPSLSSMKCATRVIWSCDNPVGDLSLYVRTAPDQAPRDIALIADAGMDVSEAQPALVGDLIASYIRMSDRSTSASRASGVDAIRDIGGSVMTASEEPPAPIVEQFLVTARG